MSSDETTERGFSLVGSDPGEASAPGVDFSTFVMSLATSALYHLGLIVDPDGDQPKKSEVGEADRALARQTIDTLEMIAAKTRGNLEPDEAKLMESILYDLHMRYVESGQ